MTRSCRPAGAWSPDRDSHVDKQVKLALDECRVLMLGAQILFGFHLRAVFERQFDGLTLSLRILYVGAFLGMAVVVGLLIAPSMQRRVVERGRTGRRILAEASFLTGIALLPFALSFAADIAIVISFKFGTTAGAALGLVTVTLALTLWYGIEYWRLDPAGRETKMPEEHDTPLDVRVDHMLTETRVLLPGAQALFGFQLVALLTEGFDSLPETSKVVHTAALCCIALSVITLMTPAALHRITFGGHNSERFHRIGSAFVVVSAVPLAIGISADIYVSVAKALGSALLGATAALGIAAVLAVLWFAQPLVLRQRQFRRRAGA